MKKPRLLLVDDSVNLTLLYKQELSDVEYNVDIANSLTEAIELINLKTYDLIIVETMLNDIKDYKTFQSKLNDYGEIPLIINTTSPSFENESPLWSIDADECIMKSSEITVLKEKIDMLLSDFGL